MEIKRRTISQTGFWETTTTRPPISLELAGNPTLEELLIWSTLLVFE
jgi:hypothetical protein